jgi:2-polyprenyl-3-methyl-5-hydroxy-6-metoxy-1,4-benzoquinol methylase
MYPPGELYEALYAKYIYKRPASELVDKAGDLAGKKVLDLCCGTGILLKECINRGASVLGIDLSEDMTAGWLIEKNSLRIADVRDYLVSTTETWNVVFCRQAVNYWLDSTIAGQLAEKIKSGGKFIFNTFNRKPNAIPVFKEYDFGGHRFIEISWLVENIVHHVQIREGLPPHTTSFKWISPHDFMVALSPHFKVESEHERNTTIYVCTKKEQCM